MASSSSAIFSGSSRYANDFSQVIERTVALASLPISQLGSQRTKLTEQETAINNLSASFASFRSALRAVGDAKSAINVSSSDGTAVSPSAETTATPGSYSIEVVSMGSRTVATSNGSLPAVSDYLTQSFSTASSFELSVGSSSYTITPEDDTLASLAEAINEDPDYGVQAVIINLGSSGSPNYKLSLQSTALGPVAIQLEESDADPQTLLTEVSQGTVASYRINGQPSGSPITTTTTSQIAVAPGLKVDLLKVGSSNIVISQDKNQLATSLATLASAYNSLIREVDESRGPSSAALNAHSILSGITQSLRRVTGFTSSGSVTSLEQLGFEFSDKGVLSFNAAKYQALPSSAVSEFLGAAGEGGLLSVADDSLETIDAETTGLLSTSLVSIRNQIAETDRQVIVNQERIELLRQRLASQMAASDALIGVLEQQVSYMTGLFEAMRINAQS